jgi:hypothetical protein
MFVDDINIKKSRHQVLKCNHETRRALKNTSKDFITLSFGKKEQFMSGDVENSV